MKILLTNHFPLTGSGSGTYTRNIAVHLAGLGHDVRVILPENSFIEPNKYPGITVRMVYFTWREKIPGALPFNFPCFTSHPRSNTNFKDLSKEQTNMYVEAFEKAIKEEVESFKPDIIHGQHLWILSSIASRTGIPTIVTAHGTDLMGYNKIPEMRHFAKEAVTNARGIIAISEDIKELVIKSFPEAADKIEVMRNGYDETIFFPEKVDRPELMRSFGINAEVRKLVFFAGKFTHFKGIDVLLKAARNYEIMDNVYTLLAGDGELSCDMRLMAKKLGLRHVHFLGNLDSETLRKLYSTADVSVVPSRREPFGLVAIEALACGAPVVATNQGGLPSIIREDVGTLVNVDDSIALGGAIQKELKASDAIERRRRARDYAKENYSQKILTRELEELYYRILEK